MNKKQEVITQIYEICEARNNFTFDNDLVKAISNKLGFKNPFDATKIDNSSVLPPILKRNDVFVVHLGLGRHQFVRGINVGYHKFEKILPEETIQWKYRRSILNELDTSESNILSVVNNQRIIHDFLYDDIVASPKSYNAHRTKLSFRYYIGNQLIQTQNLQMEIDQTFEYLGMVTIVEGKNKFPDDFAVYQLYHPYRYYVHMRETENLPIKKITCCYILRKRSKDTSSTIRLYNYTFQDENRMDSIKLLKKAEYLLISH